MTSSTTIEHEFLIDYMKVAAFSKALNNVYEEEVKKRENEEEPEYEAQKYMELNFLRKLELDKIKLLSDNRPLKHLNESFYNELITSYLARKLMNSWNLKYKYPNFRKAFTSVFDDSFDVVESDKIRLAASKGFYVQPDSKRYPLGIQPYDYIILYSQHQRKAQSKALQSRSPQLFLIINPYTVKFGFCYGQYIDPVYVEKVKEDRFVQYKLFRILSQSSDLNLVLGPTGKDYNTRKIMYNESSLNEEKLEYINAPTPSRFDKMLEKWNENSHVVKEMGASRETVKEFINKIEARIRDIMKDSSNDKHVKLKTNYKVYEEYFLEDFFGEAIPQEKEYTESCKDDILKKFAAHGDPIRKTFEGLKDFYLKVSEITPVGVNLLKQNKQLILTGVPGSGKTYLASKEIAPKLIKGEGGLAGIINSNGRSHSNYLEGMVNENNVDDFIENHMIEHVYFHPNYDYADFMEGAWPVQRFKVEGDRKRREEREVKELNYELMDGDFKKFCKKAGVLERALYGALLENKLEEKYVWKKYDELIKNFENEFSEEYSEFWGKFWQGVKKYITKDPNTPVKMKELLKILKGENYGENNINKFREVSKKLNEALPKFVYIIDNINRADLSQVFGELMFSFDPDYRGYEGRVKTKYCNLIERNYFLTDKKEDYFFIPSNVYIIGKMNNIESSEEVFNFAMRCRFVWYELGLNMYIFNMMLQDVDISAGNIDILKDKARNLNSCFSDNSRIFVEFRIGPGYFGQISRYIESDKDFKSAVDILWDFHLKPLINEYLKPRISIEEKNNTIKLCKQAFYREKTFSN